MIRLLYRLLLGIALAQAAVKLARGFQWLGSEMLDSIRLALGARPPTR